MGGLISCMFMVAKTENIALCPHEWFILATVSKNHCLTVYILIFLLLLSSKHNKQYKQYYHIFTYVSNMVKEGD